MSVRLLLISAAALALAATDGSAQVLVGRGDPVGDLLAQVEAGAEAADAADRAGDDDAPVEARARAGLRVRAASGSPVGEVAKVTDAGVVLRIDVKDRPVLKLIEAERLEVRDQEAVTDLTVAELEGLPAAE
jgi:hypothetical protein